MNTEKMAPNETGKEAKKNKAVKKEKLPKDKVVKLSSKCLLKTQLFDKTKHLYSSDEINVIMRDIKRPKVGFPLYATKICGDRIEFKSLNKGKKIKPIKYFTIVQVVPNTGGRTSLFVHVPKAKKASPFTGILAFPTDTDANKFLESVRNANPDAFKGDLVSDIAQDMVEGNTEQETDFLVKNQKKNTPARKERAQSASNAAIRTPLNTDDIETGRYSSGRNEGAPKLNTFLWNAPRSLSMSSSSFSRDKRSSFGARQTFTSYCPNRVFLNNSNLNFHPNDRSESPCSSDSYFSKDSSDPGFICRDRESIFYGERMSPKSQYVDRLLRETVRDHRRGN